MVANNMEGKWVLLQSDWIGGVCGVQPYLVTRHSGNRIYVDQLDSEWIHNSQKYEFIESTSPAGFKSASSVRFVFETRESAVQAAYFSQEEYDKWFRDQKLEMGRKVFEEAIRLGGISLK